MLFFLSFSSTLDSKIIISKDFEWKIEDVEIVPFYKIEGYL